MKYRANSICSFGLSLAALVYLLGYKSHESSFSTANVLHIWDKTDLLLFDKNPQKSFLSVDSNYRLKKFITIKNMFVNFYESHCFNQKKTKTNFDIDAASEYEIDPCLEDSLIEDVNGFSNVETIRDFCEPDCYDEKRIKTFNPCIDVIPSARGCIETNGPYLEAAYLYWHSSIEDVSVTSNIQPISTNQTKETIKQINYKYDSGFKLGLGYNLSYDSWDIFANWTRLHTHPSSSWSSTTQSLSTSLLAPFASSALVSNSAHSRWSLHFDTVDLELGRHLFLGRNLAIRPYVGLKGAWVTSTLHTSYNGINNLVFNSADVFLRDRNQGIGLRFGMQGRWDLWCSDFAILGNIAGAVLWNNMKVKNTTNAFNLDGTLGGGSKNAHYRTLKPLVECFIGLDWGSCFCRKYYLNVAAGYEMQFWWDYNIFFAQFRNTTMYDLRLHGLTTTITVDF